MPRYARVHWCVLSTSVCTVDKCSGNNKKKTHSRLSYVRNAPTPLSWVKQNEKRKKNGNERKIYRMRDMSENVVAPLHAYECSYARNILCVIHIVSVHSYAPIDKLSCFIDVLMERHAYEPDWTKSKHDLADIVVSTTFFWNVWTNLRP